ncbi:unknown [Clostridium sp. CAG:729]|nr:unknown [Clostridium sp. CAG:729]
MTTEQYSLYSMIQQQVQQQYSMAQSMWQNMFEMEREAQLQPLKDLEDSLQTEKDNLESRLKIAQAEYDAKKEEEKAGVKGLTPDYTGQG